MQGSADTAVETDIKACTFRVQWLKWQVSFSVIILDNWLLHQPVTIADYTGKALSVWNEAELSWCAGESA